MSPFLILAIGIACILGLILVLRVNAFLALVISAIVVSLLSPGSIDIKIQRVADEFGSSAGKIAIVIALAAIIGECMMASGAADRIVQAFLRLLGEKRASWALMGSGFVLAVPVFFDTVFYLLVPLARSLYRKTGKNYLLYILAIAAGGAITHTLVPPTPGPLVMASTLGIDIGLMILVGALVALPAAVAGLVTSFWFDSWLNIPFRESSPGQETTSDDLASLPPLWLSLTPVLLPVIMISANTALSTMANNEHRARFTSEDILDWPGLVDTLTTPSPTPSPVARIQSLLTDEERASLVQAREPGESRQQVISALNRLLVTKPELLYEHEAFDSVLNKRWKIDSGLKAQDLSAEQKQSLGRQKLLDDLLQKDLAKLPPHELERTSRTLLEVTFPGLIRPHVWDSPLRQADRVASLFGNANFALLLSTVVAMYLYWRQRRPTLDQLTQTVETSLMSGGTIILITAAGGAFGAMLKAAKIGDAIEASFQGGSASGLLFLLLGYGVAALLKVAQGSSTVAMITVSGMLAAMVSSPESLGYNPVYLATAIGAGSLMGSWMNDSGFWIFAKMGRLTEAEALKSWTLMLVVLSLTSLVTTLVLARYLPLL